MRIAGGSNKSSHALEQIRRDILHGEWAPGSRLQPHALAERYESSTTVIREALTRLAGESFIRLEPNRGFFVPTLSITELQDLTEVRCTIEELAVGLSIERGDLTWESELIAAHHQLSRTPRRSAADPTHVDDAWAEAHRHFHHKILEACRVPSLLSFARQLVSSTELYRRWSAPSTAAGERNVEREHQEILDAVLDRDAARAAALLRRHYELTAEVALRSDVAAHSN